MKKKLEDKKYSDSLIKKLIEQSNHNEIRIRLYLKDYLINIHQRLNIFINKTF